MTFHASVPLLAGAVIAAALPASAQVLPPPPAAGLRLGPLSVNPAISIDNVGIDTNILRERDDPRRDEVATVTGLVDLVVRLPHLWIDTTTRASADYFRRYSRQNSLNHDHRLRAVVSGTRVALVGRGRFSDGRERLNYEIDSRVRRRAHALAAGVEARITAKTSVAVEGGITHSEFDGEVEGVPLDARLRQDTRTASVELRWGVTPLTSIVASAEASDSRFQHAPVRNATRLGALAGFDFRAPAAMRGRVRLGAQRFDPRDPAFPRFDGIVGVGDVSLPLAAATRLTLGGERRLEYSFDAAQPVYLLDVAGASLVQRLGERWELEAGAGRQRLRYRSLAGADMLGPSARVDRGARYRAHVRYRVSPLVGFSINAEYVRRQSPVARRRHDTLRAGATLDIRFAR